MVLQAGGIIAFPTDTVYGLGVAYGSAEAVAALRNLKGRESAKPFQVLIASLADLETLGAESSPLSKRLAARFWPGALTMVLPLKGGGTVGVRWSSSGFVQELIRALGCPLVATSANPEGVETARSAAKTKELFPGRLPLIVDGGTKDKKSSVASTVILVQDETVRVLREGAIKDEDIIRCAREQ